MQSKVFPHVPEFTAVAVDGACDPSGVILLMIFSVAVVGQSADSRTRYDSTGRVDPAIQHVLRWRSGRTSRRDCTFFQSGQVTFQRHRMREAKILADAFCELEPESIENVHHQTLFACPEREEPKDEGKKHYKDLKRTSSW